MMIIGQITQLPKRPVAGPVVLAALASLLVHINYSLTFGSGAGQWFRALPAYYTIGWVVQLAGLFAPSLILLIFWLNAKQNYFLPLISFLLAAIAYQSWQPLILSVLSAWDLYPTHLEAFNNFTLREDWMKYE